MQHPQLPVINISTLLQNGETPSEAREQIAAQIAQACKTIGFFYITGHGVSEELQQELEEASRAFFALPEEEKMQISMSRGGRAWRGYFPVEGELTSGKPDLKEGLYFGQELPEEDPRVKEGLPLHGPNLFPQHPAGLRDSVLRYLEAMERIAHAVMRGIALSLGLSADYFYTRYTANPLILFRIFHYPPQKGSHYRQWGVGEHTDYGLLTLLKQDAVGGLQVKSGDTWIDAPPLPNSFVCNIGDMLDRMTGGVYRSTPHRVLNTSGKDRYSYPFFFDPNFAAPVHRIAEVEAAGRRTQRWDGEDVHRFEGTYGDYLLRKVGKVFPDLGSEVLD